MKAEHLEKALALTRRLADLRTDLTTLLNTESVAGTVRMIYRDSGSLFEYTYLLSDGAAGLRFLREQCEAQIEKAQLELRELGVEI